MPTKAKHNLKPNPLLTKLAKAAGDDSITTVEGYVGETEKALRLYPNLKLSTYYEFDEVLHSGEVPDDPEGRVKVYVRDRAPVQVTSVNRVEARQLGIGGAGLFGGGAGLFGGGFGFFPGPRIFTFCGPCQNGIRHCWRIRWVWKCEQIFPPQEGPFFDTPGYSHCQWESEIVGLWTESCPFTPGDAIRDVRVIADS